MLAFEDFVILMEGRGGEWDKYGVWLEANIQCTCVTLNSSVRCVKE